jgi:lactoylglutathione lyase
MPHSEIQGFDHMQMEVRDLEESIEFYRRHFGFEIHQVGVRMARRWAIVGTRGSFLALHEDKAKATQAAAGIRITHFGLVTGDFLGTRAQLADAGVRLEPDEVIEYEGSRSFYFFDPNGYKIEISEVWGGGLGSRV